MENKTITPAKEITTWINKHPLFKWGAMCDKVGLDKANFHRTLALDTPRIKEEYITKIIEEIREYGYKDAEDKADEKMKEELANDPEMTEFMEEMVQLKVGDKKLWNKAFEDAKTYWGKKKKNVNLKNLTTPSKGTTTDLNEKKKTNYHINTTGKGAKKQSDYLASRRKLKS